MENSAEGSRSGVKKRPWHKYSKRRLIFLRIDLGKKMETLGKKEEEDDEMRGGDEVMI